MTLPTWINGLRDPEWLAALRSDRFKQGQSTLRRVLPDGEELCCLGVRCELDAERGLMKRLVDDLDRTSYFEQSVYVYGTAFPPLLTVIRWGVPVAVLNRLYEMNDNGKSFAEIADIIENDEWVAQFAHLNVEKAR